MKKHVNSSDCWCKPYLFFCEEDSGVWVHRSEDGELPPPEVLALAIAVYLNSDEECEVQDE